MSFNEFPDIEAAVATALRTASISDGVYSSLPGNYNGETVIIVKRIGGLPSVRQYLDTANLQIDVWASSKSLARDCAAAARVEIFNLEGTQAGDTWISGVEDSLGLTWQPDESTARDRYLFGVNVYFRRNATDAEISPPSIATGGGV